MKKKIFVIGLCMLIIAGIFTGCNNQSDSKNSPFQQETKNKKNTEHAAHTEKKAQDVNISWHLSSSTPKENKQEKLTIEIKNNQNKPIEDYEINHEKKMHLIVVSKDLSYFNHIHPTYDGKGKFSVNVNFPKSGEYKLISDFIPKGSSQTTKTHAIKVAGSTPKLEPLQADKSFVKIVDGKEISLSYDGEIKPSKEVMLKFNLSDASTKKPITDLENYLGAIGHVVILSEDTEKYLHVHPADSKTMGPEAMFYTEFPTSGTYKIWGQFQHKGKIITVPFVITIP
ncbi:hypothetical protein [Bacillus gaemokensis]|uniref:Lipoprotein n=1 Tax=Bacillus gaemokensis TaxID=574375 RepID=A0A073K875_9BACI|nr:hypothetical protein [Bacillus gaemokensis]KEK23474.1 hypothetical protein BAGA_08215 [Bacillus gaemokensis]KYG27157.1 hypothetical protein AZF08_15495 [Bacillus gaemokensis]